ncbi:MAG TPA: alpha/beta hydrolase [Solirubrobacteraceae bacterium]|nr:alpha/beta hydrolase [Solirubrobacteraceae bacterium]
MTSSAPRTIRFASGDSMIAALHYPGTNRACIIMAGGTGMTKEPATDPFAPHFHAAGFTVLAFDFRRLGASGGSPRQVVKVNDQLSDYRAAIAFAATLPDVDPTRIAIWGFSLAGGHVLRVAAREPGLAAAIAQAPLADGPAIAPRAMRAMTPAAALRLHLRAAGDLLGRRLLRRPPVLIPLAGPRGTVASITTPDGARGGQALDPDGRYREWDQTVAAASALRLAFYRPGRTASRIACPLLVVVFDDDQTVLTAPASTAAQRAPRGELVRLGGDHYAAFEQRHRATLDAEIDFLRRHLLERASGADRARHAGADGAPGG